MNNTHIATQAGLKPSVLSVLNTLDPLQYVTEVFASHVIDLEKMKIIAASAAYDVSDVKGMKTAVDLRQSLRKVRLDADKTRKLRKEPITRIGSLLQEHYNRIEKEIKPFELVVDKKIKAEEELKEAKKAAAALIETKRIETIKRDVERLRSGPILLLNANSAKLNDVLSKLESARPTKERYAEFAEEATAAFTSTVKQLTKLLNLTTQREKNEAELIELRAKQVMPSSPEEKSKSQTFSTSKSSRSTQEISQHAVDITTSSVNKTIATPAMPVRRMTPPVRRTSIATMSLLNLLKLSINANKAALAEHPKMACSDLLEKSIALFETSAFASQ